MRGPDGRLGALDPRTRVIEMRSCGVKVKNTKRFHIVNPTNLSYEFVWECLDPLKNQMTVFHCTTKTGLVYSGKKFEMVFEYLPQDLGLQVIFFENSNSNAQESFWLFKIPQHNIEVPFVLVGSAEEPEVFLDKTHLNFNAVLIGKKLQEVVYLINKERIPFTFKLVRTSIGDEKWLEATPIKGEIAPESQLPITVAFSPNAEKKFTSNLALNISRKPTPISLNIKVYLITSMLT